MAIRLYPLTLTQYKKPHSSNFILFVARTMLEEKTKKKMNNKTISSCCETILTVALFLLIKLKQH